MLSSIALHKCFFKWIKVSHSYFALRMTAQFFPTKKKKKKFPNRNSIWCNSWSFDPPYILCTFLFIYCSVVSLFALSFSILTFPHFPINEHTMWCLSIAWIFIVCILCSFSLSLHLSPAAVACTRFCVDNWESPSNVQIYLVYLNWKSDNIIANCTQKNANETHIEGHLHW